MSQFFKSIYFTDYKSENSNSKSFTLAFSEKDNDLYEHLKNTSSLEMRSLLSIHSYSDLKKKADREHLSLNTYCLWKIRKDLHLKATNGNGLKKQLPLLGMDPIHVTFKGGKNLPLQSWYPYLEGYSPDFVEYIIDNFLPANTKSIYDPFSGSGTTPLVASSLKYTAYYSEVNPLLQFLSKVKFIARNITNKKRVIEKLGIINQTLKININKSAKNELLDHNYKKTFKKSRFFDENIYSQVLKTRSYIDELYKTDSLAADLVSVAVIGSLIKVSLLKRQGDLRFKTKQELLKSKKVDYFRVVRDSLQNIINDLARIKKSPEPKLITDDARKISNIDQLNIDAVITSPPYLNGTNYFRNTKIELWFLGYLKSQDDLTSFRRQAVTAGINDVSLKEEKPVSNPLLNDLLSNIAKKAYDKRIPKMINDYFADMSVIFGGIKKHLNKNAILAIDLGDSIYSNVHVKTDEILISVLKTLGYKFDQSITLRRRISKNGQELKQVLLLFKYPKDNRTKSKVKPKNKQYFWENSWEEFKRDLPHQKLPFSKRNWGDPIHSLCSYQGKLKPSIANMLVSTFIPPRGSVLDIFAGVGTIPLEAALQGKKSYSFDISYPAVAITRAKLSKISKGETFKIINNLKKYINDKEIYDKDLEKAQNFGFNKKLIDYFHPDTLKEIILARKYFREFGYEDPDSSLVMACVLHILHGNRPYALSRRSHGITPFAPTGEFEYKNLIEKLVEKIDRTFSRLQRSDFVEGETFYQDALQKWPEKIHNLDAIITSPPFFNSTRFYLANWMRIWFAGWNESNFKDDTVNFIEELQRKDFSVYNKIFTQAKSRIKQKGVFVMHLGKSKKCDMAKVLSDKASPWFNTHDIFEESVRSGESHGVTDKGAVVDHQYLILTPKL
jgi:tRNA G10  N-methylase Trm11